MGPVPLYSPAPGMVQEEAHTLTRGATAPRPPSAVARTQPCRRAAAAVLMCNRAAADTLLPVYRLPLQQTECWYRKCAVANHVRAPYRLILMTTIRSAVCA